MPDTIYEKMMEAYALLNQIVKTIAEKKFTRHDEGILSFDGYNSPEDMEYQVKQDIDSYLDTLDELSFFFADEELGGLKNISHKKLKKINISIPNDYKKTDFAEYIPSYKAFKNAQLRLKRHFEKCLNEDKRLNIKSSKFVWNGTQRELVELFEKLINNKWIDADIQSDHLPIVEMFNILQGGKIVALDEESFRVAWKSGEFGRNPGDYKPRFEKFPKNSTA
jgi:hypothetical protein